MSKAELRATMRRVLKKIDEAELHDASARACANLASHPKLAAAKAVSVYLAMPAAECRTLPLLSSLFEQDKAVYVPLCEGAKPQDMRMVRMPTLDHIAALPRNSWGIPEPAADSPHTPAHELVDLVVVPAVAFDRRRYRLGHGRGYYGTPRRPHRSSTCRCDSSHRYDSSHGARTAYADSYIERLAAARLARGMPRPVTIGLGLQQQLLDEVPTSPHDQRLDAVCLPDATL